MNLDPIIPGGILIEAFINPLEISQNKLARDLNVPVGRVNDLMRGMRTITTDTALRVAINFRTSPEFWLNLQSRFDLKIAHNNYITEN